MYRKAYLYLIYPEWGFNPRPPETTSNGTKWINIVNSLILFFRNIELLLIKVKKPLSRSSRFFSRTTNDDDDDDYDVQILI